MAGLYLLGLLACAVPLASFQPPQPILVLSETCYYPLNMTYIQSGLDNMNISFNVLRKRDVCESHQKLLRVLSASSRLILGTFHPEVCSSAKQLAGYFNMTLRLWNCPDTLGEEDPIQMCPSVTKIASGFARVVADMNWKSVAIITTACGWWPSLSHSLELELRDLGIIPKHSFLFEKHAPRRYIERKLQVIKKSPCRALVLCVPADETGMKIFQATRNLNLSMDNTLSILVDILSLPSWKYSLKQQKYSDDEHTSYNKIYNFTEEIDTLSQDILLFVDNVTLDLAPEDHIIKNVRESIEMSFSPSNSVSCFVLVDVFTNVSLRPLMRVFETNASAFETETVSGNFENWWMTHKQVDECDAFCKFSSDNLLSAWLYWIISSVIFLVFLIFGVVAAVRYRLLKKRTSKAPHKVLLSASDFAFPQLSDNLRVPNRKTPKNIDRLLSLFAGAGLATKYFTVKNFLRVPNNYLQNC